MALTLREAAYAMEESLRQIVGYIVDKKPHLPKFYILIHAKTFDTETIFSKVVILHRQPLKMIGTVCYEIDNRMGTQRRLWVLPLDIPLPEELFTDKAVPRSILESAQGMPIIF